MSAGDAAKDVAYMIDQIHNIEPKIEAMLQSVVNIQTAYAKALIVDRKTLAERQADCDVLGAYRVLTDAFETDVRPLLEQVRVEMGIAPRPHPRPARKRLRTQDRGRARPGFGRRRGYPTNE